MNNDLKFIAIYLPQYHPIPENDAWWGKGFTEWTNVTKAKPLFKNHYQPIHPADLGYYDLRVPEIREAQAAMAKEYGVFGFMYYHYWFGNGKTLLERPFNEVLQSGKPDFPFCLCWANESWKGVWHGEFTGKTLMEQTYPGTDDYKRHFYHLLPAFQDARYIKVDGKPLLNVYSPNKLPDAKQFAELFQELAIKEGFSGIYLVGSRAGLEWNPLEYGFSAVIGSEITNLRYGKWNKYSPEKHYYLKKKLRNVLQKGFGISIKQTVKPLIVDYGEIIDDLITNKAFPYDYYPCVIPNWDNTARVGSNAIILKNSSPEFFYQHLQKAVLKVEHLPIERKFIFIKSWNEWAEGNYLEPDTKFGFQYLQQIRRIVNEDLK